jgi:hypothetical protein
MRRSEILLIVGSIALFVLLNAQGYPPHQDWALKPAAEPGMVHFIITRAAEGSRFQSSSYMPVSAFHGLPADRNGLYTSAKFEFIQDAGKLVCEGAFNLGHGSGTFTYIPNPNFIGELERLGYSRPNDSQVFAMMMSNVTLEFARGVRDAGLRAGTGELIDLRIQGITLDYIREIRDTGYRDFTAKDFINLKIQGVTASFLRDLKKAGYDLPASEIIDLHIQGVTSEFVADLKSAGYDLRARQITDLKIQGVSSKYLRDLAAYGLKPSPEDLVQMRIQGVSPDYLKGLKDAGYENLPMQQIIDLHIQGVSIDFIRDARAAGYRFSTADLVQLRIQGVNGAYLQKLHDSGFGNLTASQIATLKINGVD